MEFRIGDLHVYIMVVGFYSFVVYLVIHSRIEERKRKKEQENNK